MRRIGLTTWIVLIMCFAVGVSAAAMTALVVVRLNRQVLASAAEIRASLGQPGDVGDPTRTELVQYTTQQAAVEAQWAERIASFRLRYPNDAIYQSVATAETVRAIQAMRRPVSVAALHERWAQAWSDRDAAMALLAKPGVTADEQARAADIARRADDELRRVRNDLQDLLEAQGLVAPVAGTAQAPKSP